MTHTRTRCLPRSSLSSTTRAESGSRCLPGRRSRRSSSSQKRGALLSRCRWRIQELAAIRLGNLSDSAPTAVLEVVDSGAHVKLTGVGKAASYLFLNNAGGSGVVLIDTAGVRRLVALATRRRQHSN